MMFIEVVTSFSSPECAEQVMKMYERLHEFQVLNCDILLLTKGSTNGVGMIIEF
jgi:peroxiredoxin